MLHQHLNKLKKTGQKIKKLKKNINLIKINNFIILKTQTLN